MNYVKTYILKGEDLEKEKIIVLKNLYFQKKIMN